MGRVIRNNSQPVLAVIHPPDAMSVQLATAMAVATLPFSPMAAGVHTSGTARGFSGDPGYGVNRWAGRTPYAVQNFAGAGNPVRGVNARSKRLGAGAGVSGQPGLPNTGGDTGGLGTLAWLGYGQLNSLGMMGG